MSCGQVTLHHPDGPGLAERLPVACVSPHDHKLVVAGKSPANNLALNGVQFGGAHREVHSCGEEVSGPDEDHVQQVAMATE